jgi:hypothetical protein
MVKTLHYAPARSLMDSVAAVQVFCLTPSLNLLSYPVFCCFTSYAAKELSVLKKFAHMITGSLPTSFPLSFIEG